MATARIRTTALFGLIILAGFAFGQGGSVHLSAYPPVAVADGSTPVTITAVVRNSGGSLVPDGTSVRFSTTHGFFREVDVPTTAGTARAVLIPPNEEVVARITATAATIGTVNTFEMEFVKDRSVLNASRQYVDVTAPDYLAYSVEIKVISATGRDRTAELRFQDITIRASDMQIDMNTLTVIARDAVVESGQYSVECRFLRYFLPRRRGIAIATVDGRTGGYDIVAASPSLSETGVMPNQFDLADLGLSTTSIHANRIVAFQHREIQFHRATMYVGDTRIMSLPLYAISPNAQAGLFSEQVIGFAGGGVQVNYPYYLSMSPTSTSVLRLRSGTDYTRGAAGSRGLFLDWENKYLAGNNGEGSVVLSGIGRSDMGLSLRHSHNFGDRTNASAMFDFPGFRSIFGSLNAAHRFDDFGLTLSGSRNESLTGTEFRSQRVDLNAETHIKKLGDLPLTYSVGLTANSSWVVFGPTRSEREAYGLRTRMLLLPQPLWEGANLTGGLTVSQLWGRLGTGTSILATTSVQTPLFRNSSLRIGYDYAADSFMSAITGRHRVTGDFFMDDGKLAIAAFGGKSLDIDGMTFFVDGSYRLSPLWRAGTSFSIDRYLGSVVTEQTVLIGYRLGLREIGITYSLTNNRIGFELLNVPFR